MGCGGTGDSLLGLLPLEIHHPDSDHIFRNCDIEDEYKVEKEPIARGKFASVRLARHRVTGEVFAAKFIRRRRRAANLEGEARHEIAVLLLGRCSPHIVHLHQVFETRSEYVIILEFGEGGDLQRLLDDQGRLSEKTVRDLLRQVLKGLGFLHQRFVAHLDIKPQNLVLMGSCPEDGVKLVDFGLSRVIHRDAELTQIMGTPDYVAPEVINFEPVGLATDMWSIGVLTYVLLTGYTPFGGDTDQETFVNITQGDFDFPEEHFGDISDQAKDFISGLLIKSTNQRMTVAQCGSHPWLSDVLDPHRLSQLSEADSADSGYSTDLCNGSPPSPGTLPNGFVPDLCQFSIPEDRQLSNHESPLHSYSKQLRPHHQFHRLGEGVDRDGGPERRPKVSGARLSMNVLECLQTQQRPQSRPLRRSSLVIPRSANDFDSHDQTFRETFTQGDAGFYDYDENQNNRIPLCPRSSLTSWNHSQIDPGSAGISGITHFDQDSHLNPSKPWNSLCYGSYTRALNQLKSPKKLKPKTNLGLRPELSCSMFELKPSYENNNMPFSDLRNSKHELRKSKADLRASKKDLRNQSKDMFSPRSDIRYSKCDFRGSTLSLDVQNIGNMASISDIRETNSDLRGLKHDSRGSPRFDLRKLKVDIRNQRLDSSLSNGNPASLVRSNLLSSHNFSSIPHLNMSLSRLDIAHETLDGDDSEERDIVYGDCTLPRRFNRNSISPLLRGNSIHMSFRRPKKRDSKI